MPASISHINQLPGQNIDEVHFLAVDSPMQWCNGNTPIPRISGSIPLEEPDKSFSKRFQNFQISRFSFGRFVDEMLNDEKPVWSTVAIRISLVIKVVSISIRLRKKFFELLDIFGILGIFCKSGWNTSCLVIFRMLGLTFFVAIKNDFANLTLDCSGRSFTKAARSRTCRLHDCLSGTGNCLFSASQLFQNSNILPPNSFFQSLVNLVKLFRYKLILKISIHHPERTRNRKL